MASDKIKTPIGHTITAADLGGNNAPFLEHVPMGDVFIGGE